MMKNIAIYGAGGCGREIKWLIDEINAVQPTWNFLGYFDDNPSLAHNPQWLGGLQALNGWNESIHVVIGVGNPVTKRKIVHAINNVQVTYATLVHPSVHLHPGEVTLGAGTVISSHCVITINISMGHHVLINPLSTIGHDTSIGDYCSIMSGVNVAGEVHLEEAVFVGLGAKIINQRSVGKDSVVGAGALVAASLPAYCTAVGVPAKPIKTHV